MVYHGGYLSIDLYDGVAYPYCGSNDRNMYMILGILPRMIVRAAEYRG